MKVNNTKIYGVASNARSAKTGPATYNKNSFYKLYPNVPDFWCFTVSSQAAYPQTSTQDGVKTTVYTYYLDTVTDAALKNYSLTLSEESSLRYRGSGKLDNGNTIVYYSDKKTLVGIAVVDGYFCVACSNLK